MLYEVITQCLINRKLYRIKVSKQPFSESFIRLVHERICQHFQLEDTTVADYFLVSDSITNSAYTASDEQINILFKNGA